MEMCVYSAGQINYKALSLPVVRIQIQIYLMPGRGKDHIVDIHYI